MGSSANVCVACGVVLRPTSTRCPVCTTEVVAGAVRRTPEPLDAAAVLVDPRRQRISRGLVEVSAALIIAGLVLSLGSDSTWGVLSAALYATIATLSAPKPVAAVTRRRASTADQAVLRQDIATGPSRAAAGGRAFQTEVEDVMPTYLITAFGLFFAVVFPVAAFVGSRSVQGRVAVGLALAGAIAAWVFRSRRETDAAGFPGRNVPID